MTDARIERLTLPEKAGLVSGESFWTTRGVEREGIPSALMTDGPHGVRLQREGADHLGIHASAPSTAFPTAAATGCSWDADLLEEVGSALGRESRRLGVDILLGPGINIKRSPLGGRNFEYFSEDPHLSGALGAAWVRGVQRHGVGAAVKHFAANNQETDRQRIDVRVDERTLREIYLRAFEHVVADADPAAVMCSYNKVNGTYASQHRWLLTDVLRDQWGFRGFVVSDWGGVADRVSALAAGMDLEMPTAGPRAPEEIAAAVADGSLDEKTLDRAAARLIDVQERLRAVRDDVDVDLDAHHELAKRVAVDSCVLLANDGLLPLRPDEGGLIGVIGELARTPRFQGGGSSRVNPTRIDDALSHLDAGTSRPVSFAPGYRLDGEHDDELAAEAEALARQAEVVLVFLGLPESEESEGFDRVDLDLPSAQLDLLRRLLAVNERIALVLSNGAVVTVDEFVGRVSAILETWLPGQAGGSAVADIILGVSEPGGRLAETIPLRLSDTPAHVNWPGSRSVVHYGERVYVGYRWYDAVDRAVAFPFGHGLGYTRFLYSDLDVVVKDPTTAAAAVELTLTNVGERTGSEVVQVYVGDTEATVDRPVRELRAFRKVRLDPGANVRLSIPLAPRDFSFWAGDDWTVEPGDFEIAVGASSRDLRLIQHVRLDVPSVSRLDESSTLGEWLADAAGEDVLRQALANQGGGAVSVLSEDMLPMVQSMPLHTVLGFGGQADGHAIVEELLASVRASTPA